MPRFGSMLQYVYPEKCPENCRYKTEIFYQGCMCSRCPVFNCKMPETEEDKKYLPIIRPEDYRDDWAELWHMYFKTGEEPKLKL